MNYNISTLGVNGKDISFFEIINQKKALISIFVLYLFTFLLIIIAQQFAELKFYWGFNFILVIIIAGRIGAFLNLVHEASHNLLFKNSSLNDFVGKWLLGFPIGVIFNDYKKRHLYHHAHTTTVKEPASDADKYLIVDYKNFKLIFLFLKDLIGISAIQVFFSVGEKNVKKQNFYQMIVNIIGIFIVQAILIIFLFRFNFFYYFIFWFYPIVGPHMFLMRIRGIAEHGLSKRLKINVDNVQEGIFYTRSFLTGMKKYEYSVISLIEKILIGSFNVNYHHEHHIAPKIPYYNLPTFHQKISTKIFNLNKFVYEKGYLSAVFKK